MDDVDQYGHLYSKISDRLFQLGLKDMDTLRNKYQRLNIDISRIAVMKMKRHQVINGIAADDFGSEAIQAYFVQCRQWDGLYNELGNKDK